MIPEPKIWHLTPKCITMCRSNCLMTYKDIKLKFPNVLCYLNHHMCKNWKENDRKHFEIQQKTKRKIENICYFEISYTGFPLSKDIRKGISKKNLLYPAPFLYHYDVCDLRILQQFIFFQCSMFEHRFVYLFSRGKSTI